MGRGEEAGHEGVEIREERLLHHHAASHCMSDSTEGGMDAYWWLSSALTPLSLSLSLSLVYIIIVIITE